MNILKNPALYPRVVMEKPRPCYTDFKLLARGPRLSNLLETASKRA